ncbi:VOC family protein [Paenibacillus sp. 1001270B_150601_E10]|uniref:VOC family protein n=1 Tax=Paenibacillus sp. 1001270B_150601_E10 TaxID=2787079 RepID=UPI00189F2645|nr:VOC family protein [Paenibacillus sp. 1001270B_150601_E10]
MTQRFQKITPNLWFNNQAEEAVAHYTSIFEHSKIEAITRYGKSHDQLGFQEGSVMTVEFQLEGQSFVALNGGPQFPFTEAISFILNCESQDEIDYYWEKLAEGGDEKAQVCGWLKDKFGVSWQIVPIALNEMLKEADPERFERVMQAMFQMKKLDIGALKEAYES